MLEGYKPERPGETGSASHRRSYGTGAASRVFPGGGDGISSASAAASCENGTSVGGVKQESLEVTLCPYPGTGIPLDSALAP